MDQVKDYHDHFEFMLISNEISATQINAQTTSKLTLKKIYDLNSSEFLDFALIFLHVLGTY